VTLERPIWRPDFHAVPIATDCVAKHRKLMKTYRETGRAPLVVFTDCVVYASPEPTPLDCIDIVFGF
jgi:hypothetical protein